MKHTRLLLAYALQIAVACYQPVYGQTAAQIIKLQASDAEDLIFFGSTVSVSGDGSTAIVGTSGRSNRYGAAYVYTRSGNNWVQQVKLMAKNAADNYSFGSSISVSGDGSTAIIGAGNKRSSKGAVYIFNRNGTIWSQQAKFTAINEAVGDGFGISVSLSSDGGTAVVGAGEINDNYRGSVYVYTLSGSTWIQQAKLTAIDAANDDLFGHSISISSDGSTIIVGASGKNSNQGAAYVYIRSGETWVQQTKLEVIDSNIFGFSVSTSSDGNTIFVGTGNKDSNNGVVYVYARSGSTWTQQAKLNAKDAFGSPISVSSDGSTVIIGAANDNNHQGASYVFTRSGNTWTQQAKLTPNDATQNDFFGYSVSVSNNGNTAIIGANAKNHGQGVAYIYTQLRNRKPSATVQQPNARRKPKP